MNRLYAICLLAGLSGITACGSTPEAENDAVASEPVPEITLNLPTGDCECDGAGSADYTFLERGFGALHEGEYLESLQYFQRYQRLEKTAQAEVEAQIAIAYLSMLKESPLYDRQAARDSYRKLKRRIEPDWKLHNEILLMRESLETFVELQKRLSQLNASNATLRSELAAREEAIKRLRDLTLGREPSTED
jgi:hypothetical protein